MSRQTAPSWTDAPSWADLARLRESSAMYDAVIDEIDGRRIRVGDEWLIDFASCNYLGFDLDPEIMDAIGAQVRRWGTHPSWSRLLGSPRLYPEIEERLTELLGAPNTLVLPTITHIHFSAIPALVGRGTVYLDSRAHKTIYDGCVFARGHGARVQRFRSGDVDHLEQLLRANRTAGPRLVCMDGVNSMTGNLPDLTAFAKLCRAHDAMLYVDDAHGFGVIGERCDGEASPYGRRGNSIVRHLGENYDNIVLVGGFSKAYSSLLAFVAVPSWLKDHLKVAAPPYLYSGPSPVASLATVLAGFEVNAARGDQLRSHLHALTDRVLGTVHALGLDTPNVSGLPVVELPLADGVDLEKVARELWRSGIYVTLAAYPLVPRNQVGVRIQITAAHTFEQVNRLSTVLADLAGRAILRTRIM